MFAYLGQIDQLIAAKSQAKTTSQFNDLDHIEKALAVRAGYCVRDLRERMKSSSASNKEQENEIFALDIGHTVRLHLIYLSYKIAKDHLAASSFKDDKIK